MVSASSKRSCCQGGSILYPPVPVVNRETRAKRTELQKTQCYPYMGHMSRAMLERYSHIRITAKRQAMDALINRSEPSNLHRVSIKIPTVELSGPIK